MEDEGFVDDDFIDETARDYVKRHGFNCIAVLQERVEIAKAAGDHFSGQLWDEIVRAAERMIYPFGSPTDP
jgi:hypothetical protein